MSYQLNHSTNLLVTILEMFWLFYKFSSLLSLVSLWLSNTDLTVSPMVILEHFMSSLSDCYRLLNGSTLLFNIACSLDIIPYHRLLTLTRIEALLFALCSLLLARFLTIPNNRMYGYVDRSVIGLHNAF